MDADVVLPISIRFEDGEVEEFQNREELELDLEYFGSETSRDSEVRDKLGRRVRLKVHALEIKNLSVAS